MLGLPSIQRPPFLWGVVMEVVDPLVSPGAIENLAGLVAANNEICSRILTLLYIGMIILLAYLLCRLYYKILSLFI